MFTDLSMVGMCGVGNVGRMTKKSCPVVQSKTCHKEASAPEIPKIPENPHFLHNVFPQSGFHMNRDRIDTHEKK